MLRAGVVERYRRRSEDGEARGTMAVRVLLGRGRLRARVRRREGCIEVCVCVGVVEEEEEEEERCDEMPCLISSHLVTVSSPHFAFSPYQREESPAQLKTACLLRMHYHHHRSTICSHDVTTSIPSHLSFSQPRNYFACRRPLIGGCG
jgi:hypothetical protein